MVSVVPSVAVLWRAGGPRTRFIAAVLAQASVDARFRTARAGWRSCRPVACPMSSASRRWTRASRAGSHATHDGGGCHPPATGNAPKFRKTRVPFAVLRRLCAGILPALRRFSDMFARYCTRRDEWGEFAEAVAAGTTAFAKALNDASRAVSCTGRGDIWAVQASRACSPQIGTRLAAKACAHSGEHRTNSMLATTCRSAGLYGVGGHVAAGGHHESLGSVASEATRTYPRQVRAPSALWALMQPGPAEFPTTPSSGGAQGVLGGRQRAERFVQFTFQALHLRDEFAAPFTHGSNVRDVRTDGGIVRVS